MAGTPANSRVPQDDAGDYELMPTGALAQTASRTAVALATHTLTSGTLRLVGIFLPSSLLVTSISFLSGTTALAAGTNQLFGIFDDAAGSSSGVARALLRGTADDGAAAWAASTVKTLALTTPYSTPRAGMFYLGVLVVAGTTPTLAGTTGQAAVYGLAPVLAGASTAAITALPDPAGAPTAATIIAYAYVS